jgi:outer membrane receptor for ferrienterochelin and colicins
MASYTAEEHPTFARGILGDLRLKRGFGDLGYELDASARWKMTFNATYSRSVMDVPQFPSIHRDSYEGDLEWTNFITISENDRLTFGAVYNHIQGVETYFGVKPSVVVANGTRNAGGVYVQYEHKLSDAVKLIGGVQFNKIGAIGIHTDPRGGILWTPSSHVSMKLLYGAAYNAPSLDQTLIHHPGLRGNPNLAPENVGTLDAQVSYQNNRIQASMDYFHSRQTDLIIQNGGVFPIVFYNNRTAVNFQGGEAEGKVYLKHDWFLIGSVLYQVDSAGAGQDLSTNPSTLVKGGVSYLSANGTAASFFDAYQTAIAGYESTLNPPSTAFHSISAHARYDLSKRWWKESARGFALFLNADNLLNKAIWLPALGFSPANTIPVIRGRTVFFGIEAWQK